MPEVLAVHVGQPRDRVDAKGSWRSAFAKAPCAGPVRLGAGAVEGDVQADPDVHGGPDRAVLAYAAAHYPGWREEFPQFAFPDGSFGENLVVEGLAEATACIGDVWALGEALLQVSYPRVPCWKISRHAGVNALLGRVVATGRVGWFHRVLREGAIGAGELRLVERPHPAWSVERAYAAYKAVAAKVNGADEEALALAALPALARDWRARLPTLASRMRGA